MSYTTERIAIQTEFAFGRAQFDRFIKELPFPPNKFQMEILESLAFGGGNILVNALAGSGKTALLIQCAVLLTKMGVIQSDAMFLAFNVKIRDEMTKRLPPGWTAINSHRLGMQLLKSHQPITRVDFNKWKLITEKIASNAGFNLYVARKMLENMCSKAMMSNLKLVNLTSKERDLELPQQLTKIAFHYGILDVDTEEQLSIIQTTIKDITNTKTGWNCSVYKDFKDRLAVDNSALVEGIKVEKGEFTCKNKKCNSRECYFYQLQTRSADEGMTNFVICTKCGER